MGSNLGSFLVTIRAHTFWRLVSIQSDLDWITNFLNVEASFRSPLLSNGLSEKDILLGKQLDPACQQESLCLL